MSASLSMNEPNDLNTTETTERLIRFFNPRSIAVIGGSAAERVLWQCQKLGYAGPMWAVNTQRAQLAGIPCYRTIAELPAQPDSPDSVFIAIPAAATIEVVRALRHAGVGGVVCLASGFKEVGAAGQRRQTQLRAAAADMPLLGPNCYGYINALLGAALFPDQHGLTRVESGVAIITASGNLGINFTLQQRGLNLAWLITVGNQAVIGIEQVLAAALANPAIRAVGIHMEGLCDLPSFIALANTARTKGIPIIVLKAGQSAIGARITLSHTATLTGSQSLYRALFARLGVGLVDDCEEFLEALKLANNVGVLPGNRIASLSCSGGEASLLADLAQSRALTFPPITEPHRQQLQATLNDDNDYVAITNPLDYHTFIWGDRPAMTRTFTAMMAGKYDLIVLIIDFPLSNDCDLTDWESTLHAFITACKKTQSRGAVITCLAENINAEIHQALTQNGLVGLHGMPQALTAIETLSTIGMAWQSRTHHAAMAYTPRPFFTDDNLKKVTTYDEYDAKQWLQKNGIASPPAARVNNITTALNQAQQLEYPVVLKALATEMTHKSEHNAVIVGIENDAELRRAVTRLLQITPTLLIEKMVGDGLAELLVGVSYDAVFGHYLSVGCGGTLVELIDEHATILLPTTEPIIHTALQSLKMWPLLNGYRGRKKVDIPAVVRAIMHLTILVQDRAHNIVELEINPLLLKEKGVVAVDAILRRVE